MAANVNAAVAETRSIADLYSVVRARTLEIVAPLEIEDYVVHRPDLPLYAGSRQFGLGLWNHRGLVIAIELAMFAIAIWIYHSQTKAKDGIGKYVFWGFIVFLLAVYALVVFGPAPPTVNKLAIGTLLTWLLIPWAWWFDKHREVT